MMNRKRLNRTMFAVWMVVASMFLAACRPSPVLEQVIYEEENEVDEDNQSKDNQEEYEEEDQELSPNQEVDDAQSQRDQSREDAINGDGNANVNNSYSSDYNQNAETTGTASGGSNASSQVTENTSGSGTGQADSGGNGQADEGDNSGTDINPVDEETTRQITDARGEVMEVPQNVGTVTAVGQAALMVEMLGGNGRLLGSSASFLSEGWAQSVYGGDFANVNAWWDGDYSTISDGNFAALLEAHPDVCIEISGSTTFTEAQITQLTEAGIAYFVLYPMNTLENIKNNVYLLGQALGDRSADGGTNAVSIAADYVNWTDSMVGQVSGSGSAKSTFYVETWDFSATWSIENNQDGVYKSGTGVAIASNSTSYSALSNIMSYVNVTNEGIHNRYLNPLRNNYWLHYVNGGSGSFRYGYTIPASTSGASLGSEEYPAIIVASDEIKNYIESDFDHWGVYGMVTDSAGVSGIGFFANDHIIQSSIAGPYGVYVNPSGVGSWTAGVEAPLEALWLAYIYQDSYSLGDLQNAVSDFYSRFYGVSVDPSSIITDSSIKY